MKEEITIDEIISFIRYYLDDDIRTINPQTRLQQDLRIYGYDAEDFFSEFSKKFNVNLENIELKKYFLGEGGVWKPWLWGRLNLNDESDKEPFKVQDLYDLANQLK